MSAHRNGQPSRNVLRPRRRSKAKNAQEAHEAVRPTWPARLPAELAAALPPRSPLARLYELVWRRAAASQMADARIAQARAATPPHVTCARVLGGRASAAGLARQHALACGPVSSTPVVGGRRLALYACARVARCQIFR